MSNEDKAKKLKELIPDMNYTAAKSWFPLDRDSATHELHNEYVDPRRRLIIETVLAIEDGIVDSPLYKALE